MLQSLTDRYRLSERSNVQRDQSRALQDNCMQQCVDGELEENSIDKGILDSHIYMSWQNSTRSYCARNADTAIDLHFISRTRF